MRQNVCPVARVGRCMAAPVLAAALACGALVTGPAVAGSVARAGATSLVKGACAARSLSGAVTLELTLKIVKSGPVRVPMVAVCVDRKGPYHFLVSTGAGSSVISPALVRSLHLKKGVRVPVRGVTCITSAPTVAVKNWSMAGLKLAAQHLVVANIPRDGLSPAPKGIIGSDLLARFRAVGIDYFTSRLFLLEGEGAAPKGNVYVLGQSKASPPPTLVKGSLKLDSVLRVFESPQGTIVAAPVKIGGHTEQLAVDSGSPTSGLLPSIGSSLKLLAGSRKVTYAGIGCKGKAAVFSSGGWALGGSVLPAASLVSRPIAGTINAGLEGVIGADVISHDGGVIVDYAGAHLWLTSG